MKAASFIVRLTPDRQDVFEEQVHEDTFAEPVPEFNHSRNLPLVCFIVNNAEKLTHIALGSRGRLAGTDLRRLNLEEFFELKDSLSVSLISEYSPTTHQKRIDERLTNGGLLSPKASETFIQIICELAPETVPILSRYSADRIKRIENLPKKTKEVLAEQKEAVATALSIASIDRDELLGWDLNQSGETSSFLDGLEQVRLREDSMVINDLKTVPGYELLKNTQHSASIFENEESKLTVVLANRLPLEEQLGVDLIYYNETFSCFLMIQYKAMEKEGSDSYLRFPNNQLTEEVRRMDSVLVELGRCPSNTEADGYRLSENPFFLKVCPRIVFNPDNVGLVKGMYLPLDYWKLLSEHKTLVGPNGGKRLSYRNVRRYFDNSSFINIASGGWVGTNIQQSHVLEEAIRSTLASGRAVVLAVNIDKDNSHRIKLSLVTLLSFDPVHYFISTNSNFP